jgi:hypothetical protein
MTFLRFFPHQKLLPAPFALLHHEAKLIQMCTRDDFEFSFSNSLIDKQDGSNEEDDRRQ